MLLVTIHMNRFMKFSPHRPKYIPCRIVPFRKVHFFHRRVKQNSSVSCEFFSFLAFLYSSLQCMENSFCKNVTWEKFFVDRMVYSIKMGWMKPKVAKSEKKQVFKINLLK